MKFLSVTIHMKATEHHFPVVLFIMLYKVVRAFDSVCPFKWKLLRVLSCGSVYDASEGASSFESVDES